ncbi:MAG: prepilin-type N-terminal cleavage/methylation domain-containing protein [Planctomycetota bacterium]
MSGRRGLTLVELLLVITLLAALAAALAGSWRVSAGPSDAALDQWRQLDAWARAQARAGRPGFWQIADEGLLYRSHGRQLRETAINGWRLHDLDGDPLDRLTYDARGWREDVLVLQRGRWWRSGGLSGCLVKWDAKQ